MDQRVWVSVWLYCLKQLSPELREKCFVTADPAGNAKPHTFRVTDTHRDLCACSHNLLSIHSTYKICIPKGGWVSVTLALNISQGLYNKCWAEFCQIKSNRGGIYPSPEQIQFPWVSQLCLPPVDGTMLYVFFAFSLIWDPLPQI